MNKIFKVVKNAFGVNVVASELARGRGKGKTLATVLLASLLSGSALAATENPVPAASLGGGVATGNDAVALGTDTYATSLSGIASGNGAVATGQGFSRDDFAKLVEENNAAVQKQKEALKKIADTQNMIDATNSALNSLDDQINNLNNELNQVNTDLEKKAELEKQKVALQDTLATQNEALVKAKENLDGISTNGKNLYLNFTDVLNSLNWTVLTSSSDSEANRNTLSTELQNKIESQFSDFAGKYSSSDYRGIIDGYINRQASYQGSYEYLMGQFSSEIIQYNKGALFNSLYFNSTLDNTDYVTTDNYEYTFDYGGWTVSAGHGMFGSYVTDKGRVETNAVTYHDKNRDFERQLKEYSPENYLAVANTMLLAQKSYQNAKNDSVYTALIGKQDRTTLIELTTNLKLEGGDFSRTYNNLIKQKQNPATVSFGVKKINGENVENWMYDKNIGILSKIKDMTVSNSNLISTDDINFFKSFYNSLKTRYSEIDWDFTESAINLDAYKASFDKVLAFNAKIDKAVDLYQEIINERKKSDSDSTKVDSLTEQLMTLKGELVSEAEDKTNYMVGMDLQYNKEYADKYLNYAKTETDAIIKRINSELKLYDPTDEIIVDATTAAKAIQSEYDKAKEEADKTQSSLDEINSEIKDLPNGTKADEISNKIADKEKEKATEQGNLADLNNNQTANNTELDEANEALKKSSLTELGVRSQAYGTNAYASGDDSIALGTNATTTSESAIAIGTNVSVTGNESVAVGADNTINGNRSVSVGYGNAITGDKSIAIGDPNTITGNYSAVLGNNATITGDYNVVAGNENTVTANSSTAVGNYNTVTGENSTLIGNNGTMSGSDSFALGNNVTVATDNSVALGSNSTTSTAVGTSNITIDGTTYEFAGTDPVGTVSVGSSGAERTITNVAAGQVSETSTDAINGSQLYAVTSALNASLSAISTNISEAVENATWNVTTSASNGTVSGSSVQNINSSTTLTLDAGNGIAITQDGANISIASTVTQTNLVAGDNVELETETNATTGAVTYTINSKATPTTLSAGDNVVLNSTSNSDGSITYTVSANSTTVSAGSGISVDTTTSTGDNGATITNYAVSLSSELLSKVAQEESVVSGNTNLVVTSDTTNDTGGKEYTVTLADNLDLGDSGSVTMGNVSVSADGINAGNTTISNVATPVNATDAANKDYVDNGRTAVTSSDSSLTVNATTDSTTGKTTYDVVLNERESVSAGSDNIVVNTTTNDSNGTNFVVDLAENVDLGANGSLTIGNVSIASNAVDVGGNTITNVSTPVNSTDAATKQYVDDGRTALTSNDGTVILNATTDATTGKTTYDLSSNQTFTVGDGNGTNITVGSNGHFDIVGGSDYVTTNITGSSVAVDLSDTTKSAIDQVANNTQNIAKGLNTLTDDNVTTNYQLGDTISITGDSKNISTTTNAKGAVQVNLADDIVVDSVVANNTIAISGGPSMSTSGINAAGNKITNVAAGDVSATSTDAVNGSQLHATNQAVINLGDQIQQTNNRVDNLDKKVNRLDKKRKAGMASAMAAAGLPQAHREGQSGFVAAIGQYQNQTAVAVGYTRLSDNGKQAIRVSASANKEGEVGGNIGYGYFW